ncbi:MAG TPA: T9SS type A sorting domain-containing protein [Bacteroidales bacterium]
MKKENYALKNLMQLLLSLIFLLAIPRILTAQQPTTQDCLGAIPVCDYIYSEETTASGYGNYFEIPNGGNNCPNHCMDGEKNSRWYVFTVISSGNLKLSITPVLQTADYDWAVWNLTEYKCEDIYAHPDWLMASCNAAGGGGYQGTTGISTANGGNSNCNNGGPTNKWNIDLPVYEGETYAVVVSDWTQTTGGYTLDFTASTAVIFDDQKPYIQYIGGDLITDCGTNELAIKFNENVKCSTVDANDFKLSGPGGPYTIDSVYGENCVLGGEYERDYILYFSPPIYREGDYAIDVKFLSSISDACNNFAQVETYPFTVELNSPVANAGSDIDIPYAGTTTLSGSASGGTGSYSYHWEPADLLENADIAEPTTLSLTASQQFTLTVTDDNSTCVGEDLMMVNVVGGPLGVVVTASSNEVCNGEIVNLYANPDGGSGNYTYLWTSTPPGFTSTEQNPSDYPTVTTTYNLEITDGFTTIEASTTVIAKPMPVANAGIDQTINEGTTTILNGTGSGGTGNFSYYWEPAGKLVQNDIPNPQTVILNTPTIFTLYVNDANGCISLPDNVLINTAGPALAAFPLADPPEICNGESVTVSANAAGGGGDYSYQWTSNPAGFTSDQASFVVSPSTSTRYDLVLTDQFNNSFSAHINVTVNQKPVINLIPENSEIVGSDTIVVCVRDSVMLDAGSNSDPVNTTYFWNQNYENRFYRASTNGNWFEFQTHSVVVKNGVTGCQNNGKITIIFDFNQCAISVPEPPVDLKAAIDFQPNPNAGKFTISIQQPLSDLQISICDLNGRVVYEDFWQGNYDAGYKKQIQLKEDLKGIYLLSCQSGTTRVVKKMVIQ